VHETWFILALIRYAQDEQRMTFGSAFLPGLGFGRSIMTIFWSIFGASMVFGTKPSSE
jgi:hypothetical protein